MSLIFVDNINKNFNSIDLLSNRLDERICKDDIELVLFILIFLIIVI